MKILSLTNNYVSVTPVQRISEFNFLLPTSMDETQRWGFVNMVGPGVPDSRGELIPTIVQPGQLVYMMMHGQESITDPLIKKATDVVIVSEFDLLGMADPIYTEEKITGVENFQPLGSYCLIEKIELDHEYQDILLPDTYTIPPNLGRILRTGLGWMTMDRKTVPLQVNEGDMVLFRPYNVLDIKLHLLGIPGHLYLIDHQDILGIVSLNDDQ